MPEILGSVFRVTQIFTDRMRTEKDLEKKSFNEHILEFKK